MQLTGCADNTKCGGIRVSIECIDKCIIIRIRRSDRRADVLPGGCIFRDGSGGATAIGEYRRVILGDICDTDRDKCRTCETGTIRHTDRKIGVCLLRFIIQGCLSSQLPCVRVNTERVLIAPLQRIGQSITTIRVCGLERRADVCVGCGVLRDGECDAILCENRFLIDVCQIDRDANAGSTALDILGKNGKHVGVLRFIVQGGFGLELPCCANNTKSCRILPNHTMEPIDECIVICIRRSDRCADVYPGCGVLCDGARRAVTICEHRDCIRIT